MKIPTPGRGKNMSIAKAAIVWFFEGWKKGDAMQQPTRWDWGDFGFSHEIIDIAGAKQCGPNTTHCVSAILAKSDLWNKRFYQHLYPGFGTGAANVYTPSEAGKEWFKKYKTQKTSQLKK